MFLKAEELSLSNEVCSDNHWINSDYILDLNIIEAAKAQYRIIASTFHDRYVLNEFDTEEKAIEWLNELVRKIEFSTIISPTSSVANCTIR